MRQTRHTGVVVVAAALLALLLSSGGASYAQQAGSPAAATDGQQLSGQPASTQAAFEAVWGDRAAQEWATEHDAAIGAKAGGGAAAIPGLTPSQRLSATDLGLPPQFAPRPPNAPPIAADTTVVSLSTTVVPALNGRPTSTDIMAIDQSAHRLYYGDFVLNGIDVIDVSTPNAKYLKTLPIDGGALGLVAAPDLKKLFAATGAGPLDVIDTDPSSPTFDTVIASVSVGPAGVDELDYDPIDHKVYVTDPGDQIVASVDAIHNTIIKLFTQMPMGVEQPRYNPGDGMMYESVGDDNMLQQFDPVHDVLVKQFKLGDPCMPVGLAISPSRNLALLGCRAQHTVFWDLKAGQVVASVNNDGSGDEAIYNAKVDRFFFATGGFHRGGVVGMFDGTGKFITNVPTTAASHTLAYDQTNNIVYTVGGQLLSFPVASVGGAP